MGPRLRRARSSPSTARSTRAHPAPGPQLCADAARTAYHAAGAEEKFVLRIQPNTGRKVLPEFFVAAREWFAQWLKP